MPLKMIQSRIMSLRKSQICVAYVAGESVIVEVKAMVSPETLLFRSVTSVDAPAPRANPLPPILKLWLPGPATKVIEATLVRGNEPEVLLLGCTLGAIVAPKTRLEPLAGRVSQSAATLQLVLVVPVQLLVGAAGARAIPDQKRTIPNPQAGETLLCVRFRQNAARTK
jgi:hypothetical protein